MSNVRIAMRVGAAQRLAAEGYQIAARMQPGVEEEIKYDSAGRATFLTAADGAVEAFLLKQIQAEFPKDAVIGEEGANRPVTPGSFCWILDPVDGTDNFSRRLQPWAVSIGIVQDGLPCAAAVCVAGNVYSTYRTSGCVLRNDVAWKVPAERPANRRIIGMEGLKRLHDFGQLYERLEGNAHQLRRCSSFIGQVIYVLEGRLDAHLEGAAGLWDVAAVALLLQEAGLKFTRWDGSPVFPHAWEVAMNDLAFYRDNYGQFDALIAHPQVHKQLVDLLAPWAGEVERGVAQKLAEKKTGG